jgi:hypothetical protein
VTPSENRPHVVFRKGQSDGEVELFPNYILAWERWLMYHTVDDPFVIGTIERVIEPQRPIIDVNE